MLFRLYHELLSSKLRTTIAAEIIKKTLKTNDSNLFLSLSVSAVASKRKNNEKTL